VTWRLDAPDREWLEWRVRELMAEGYGRVRAMYLAVDELRAERRRAEDELIRAKGADPDEIDRRIADR
jgi:uncharacterized protein YoaH (UPF0181 family)